MLLRLCEDRPDTQKHSPPTSFFSLDEVHVASVLDIGVISIEDDRVDASRRCLPRTEGMAASVNPFLVMVLSSTFSGKEIVESFSFDDMTALGCAKRGVFCQVGTSK
jgi:hypothetical protein